MFLSSVRTYIVDDFGITQLRQKFKNIGRNLQLKLFFRQENFQSKLLPVCFDHAK